MARLHHGHEVLISGLTPARLTDCLVRGTGARQSFASSTSGMCRRSSHTSRVGRASQISSSMSWLRPCASARASRPVRRLPRPGGRMALRHRTKRARRRRPRTARRAARAAGSPCRRRVGCVNPIGWAVVCRRDLASALRRELAGRPTNTDDYVYAPHRLLLPLLTRESRSAEPFSRNDCYSSWMSRKGCRPGSRSLP
jgi:hypothetical protein